MNEGNNAPKTRGRPFAKGNSLGREIKKAVGPFRILDFTAMHTRVAQALSGSSSPKPARVIS